MASSRLCSGRAAEGRRTNQAKLDDGPRDIAYYQEARLELEAKVVETFRPLLRDLRAAQQTNVRTGRNHEFGSPFPNPTERMPERRK